ncbi:hypothetical protein SteCoe_17065 [Stentor coeruleus]|uniref:Uncharacterized protein n=1 Tax=Stentor coeruleus TaxID=5963 RepID=A0A1R2BZW0_9CILI|nr:hypothetical protein SteCoe_17065 [Stentor coeruleus]
MLQPEKKFDLPQQKTFKNPPSRENSTPKPFKNTEEKKLLSSINENIELKKTFSWKFYTNLENSLEKSCLEQENGILIKEKAILQQEIDNLFQENIKILSDHEDDMQDIEAFFGKRRVLLETYYGQLKKDLEILNSQELLCENMILQAENEQNASEIRNLHNKRMSILWSSGLLESIFLLTIIAVLVKIYF